MNRSAKIEVIELAYRAGLSREATARILNDLVLVKTYWVQPECRVRQSTFERQRAMAKLVQVLHRGGIKSTVIARFCGLSDRQVITMIAREL